MTRLFTALLVLVAAAFFAATNGAAKTEPCLAGLKQVLETGGFTGSTNCSGDELSMRKVGTIQSHGVSFAVYDYRYRLGTGCKDCAVHGGQRVIFLRSGRYLGQYKPDSANVRIVGARLVLSPVPDRYNRNAAPVTIDFSAHGPPKRLLFDGEVLELFR